MRWLVFALMLVASPAFAAGAPPKECRGKPDPSKYVLQHVDNVNRVCGSLGKKVGLQRPGLFQWYAACTLPGLLNGKRPVALIIMPKRKGFGYQRLLEHEFGHVNCPQWKH